MSDCGDKNTVPAGSPGIPLGVSSLGYQEPASLVGRSLDTICRYHGHCGDAAGTHCHQFGHLCGNPCGWATGSCCGDARLRTSFLHIVMAVAHVCYHFKGLSALQGILSGLRPGVGAMIAAAGRGLLFLTLYGSRELPLIFLRLIWSPLKFSRWFFVLHKWRVNPIWVMMVSGLAGVLLYAVV